MSLNTLSFSPRLGPHGSGPGLPGRTPSLERLHPSHSSPLRRSTLVSSSFNLVATVIGGGVLSLPYAFASCGLAYGVCFTLCAAAMADFSLYILCSCARRTGTESYGDVAKHCFGEGCRVAVTAVLFVFLMFVTTAFFILTRDIMSSVVEWATGATLTPRQNTEVLIVCVLATFPFMLLKDLYSLRHNCYVGFVSVLLLLAAMVYRAVVKNKEDPEIFQQEVVLMSDDPFDSLFRWVRRAETAPEVEGAKRVCAWPPVARARALPSARPALGSVCCWRCCNEEPKRNRQAGRVPERERELLREREHEQ